MRLYLIDYENVNSVGLQGIGRLSQNDRVILFYSHSANTLSFEIMDEMLSTGILPERVCLTQSGKNALDFQLVTFLGYLIAKNTADEYYIISKDAGYSAAIAFCKEYLGTKVQLRPSIKATLTGKPASVSLRKRATVIQVQPMHIVPTQADTAAANITSEEDITLETVLALVEPNITDEIAAEILHCLQESHSKTEFHNALQQHFDNDSVKEYYRCMKPCFAAALAD